MCDTARSKIARREADTVLDHLEWAQRIHLKTWEIEASSLWDDDMNANDSKELKRRISHLENELGELEDGAIQVSASVWEDLWVPNVTPLVLEIRKALEGMKSDLNDR